MNKKITTAIIFVLSTLTPVLGAELHDPVKSFEQLVENAKQKTESEKPVYFNDFKKKWAKRIFEIHNLEYDVKANDSLAFPALGVIKFDLYFSQSKLVKNKEEAIRAKKFETRNGEGIAHSILNIKYKYNGREWIFTEAEVTEDFPYPDIKDINYSFTEEKIKRKPSEMPQALILYWMNEK